MSPCMNDADGQYGKTFVRASHATVSLCFLFLVIHLSVGSLQKLQQPCSQPVACWHIVVGAYGGTMMRAHQVQSRLRL